MSQLQKTLTALTLLIRRVPLTLLTESNEQDEEQLQQGTVWAFLFLAAGGSTQTEEEENEKRPYKFAFNIEGYQHRSEEKDERGIINGEYGFVTGDGVYHVTVYATDENGDFKILSMKNYYIGLPGQETTTAVVTVPPRPRETPPPPTIVYPSYLTTTVSPIIQHLNGLMGCSGCIIPQKKATKPNTVVGLTQQPGNEDDIDIRFGDEEPLSPNKPNNMAKPFMGTQFVPFNEADAKSTTPCSDCGVTTESRPSSPGSRGKAQTQVNTPSRPNNYEQRPQVPGQAGIRKPTTGQFGQAPSPVSSSDLPSSEGQRTPEIPTSEDDGIPELFNELYAENPDYQSPGDESPPSVPNQSNPVSPTSVAESDRFAQELFEKFYQFHYILSYNGHNETGYRNGNKEGDYFVNGRDGLGRNVKYVANEFGYQPNITLVNLGLESPNTPKERDEEPNELKSSEFRWFYGS